MKVDWAKLRAEAQDTKFWPVYQEAEPLEIEPRWFTPEEANTVPDAPTIKVKTFWDIWVPVQQ